VNRFLLAFFFFSTIFYPCLALCQTNPVIPPNFSSWNTINTSRIELRVSDCASVYLGTETDYMNPDDPMEFARVISRHIAVPINKCKEHNKKSVVAVSTSLYTQKVEQDLLTERSSKNDSFLFVRWRVEYNSRTEHDDKPSGDVDIWFRPSDGNWIFRKNIKVEVESLTENIGDAKSNNVFSGVMYRIGGLYHIVRVSRDNIIDLIKKGSKES
jgi:hypothetical protein